MRTWGNFGCDFVEMELHGFAIAGRQNEGGAGPAFGAHSTEQIGRLGALIDDTTPYHVSPPPRPKLKKIG